MQDNKPQSQAIRWTKAQRRRLATPTAADIAKAKRLWQRYASAQYARLLGAVSDGTK